MFFVEDLRKGHDKTRSKLECGNLCCKSQLPLRNLCYCWFPSKALGINIHAIKSNWSDSGDHGSLVHINRPHGNYFNAIQYKKKRDMYSVLGFICTLLILTEIKLM